MPDGSIFSETTINRVRFKNRVVRSSIGGRTAYYDGTVNNAWVNFEARFAAPFGDARIGVGGIISATLTVDDRRWAPLEYPSISKDKYVGPLRDAISYVHKYDCRYIIQIGDPGYQVQTSLFSEPVDEASASGGLDLFYGYRNVRTEMTREEIRDVVAHYCKAADRVQRAGADGIEITASKGYLIHQFLNPAVNRRNDDYGVDRDGRFRLLREIIEGVRTVTGADFLLGVRISARDRHYLPYVNLRWPPRWLSRTHWTGQTLEDSKWVAKKLQNLGVDYLHVSNGFGFINPHETPGKFPTDYIRRFAASTAHLSAKAKVRSTLCNWTPNFLFNIGWSDDAQMSNAADAKEIGEAVSGMPVIANGGIHSYQQVEQSLRDGAALVSMARPLLANPRLLESFRSRKNPENPCTRCNNCAVATTLYPLGCYDRGRYPKGPEGLYRMQAEIDEWSANPAPSVL